MLVIVAFHYAAADDAIQIVSEPLVLQCCWARTVYMAEFMTCINFRPSSFHPMIGFLTRALGVHPVKFQDDNSDVTES